MSTDEIFRKMQTVQGLVPQAGGVRKDEETAKAFRQFCVRAARLSRTEDGRALLSNLRSIFGDGRERRFRPGETTHDAAFRDGASFVMTWIHDCIASGEKLKNSKIEP